MSIKSDKGKFLTHFISEKTGNSGPFLAGDAVFIVDQSYEDQRTGEWVERKHPIPFNCYGKLAERVATLPEGAEAEIKYEISGREHNGKYYASLKALSMKFSDAVTQSFPGEEGKKVDDIEF